MKQGLDYKIAEREATSDTGSRANFPTWVSLCEILLGFVSRGAQSSAGRAGVSLLGLGLFFLAWWGLTRTLQGHPQFFAFANMAPEYAMPALLRMLEDGVLVQHTLSSLGRIAGGLAWAAVLGVSLGLVIGFSPLLGRLCHLPFQLLRMVSPLSWMPIAVLAFATWSGAITFIIAMAAVWPVVFATANGVKKLNPGWFSLAQSLRSPWYRTLAYVVFPAISQDLLTGLRLALGVAWIVLVPAEYLGVTSGLGYAINDARDALEYDRLAAVVMAISIIGFSLDLLFLLLVKQTAWRQLD